MILTKHNLSSIASANIDLPNQDTFDLPEKVLQFGTGVLLRGLPDYFIDKANKKGEFNGRIAVVKSTIKGDVSAFDEQDGLYTICVRGILEGRVQEENIVSSAISRVIDANSQWNEVLLVAESPLLKLIVSNTTEVGLVFLEESIHQSPPVSYPAKLLAVLHTRFKALGNNSGDLAVIATELIPNNGKFLRQVILELCVVNKLEDSFVSWMESTVFFCNSLVDRIVPGKPENLALDVIERELGYHDDLLIMAEPYRLWAIEGDQSVAELLGLESADPGVIIRPDIEIYRELKVRLLNGTHTLTCGIAHLAGINTVSEAMDHPALRKYVEMLMQTEIIPGIPYPVDQEEAFTFSKAVLDRFANPFIKHQWINITFQYTMKLKIRIVPIIAQYYNVLSKVPDHISFGFAGYLVFMTKGEVEGVTYTITDDSAAYFQGATDNSFIQAVLSDTALWGIDLTAFEGFEDAVTRYFNYITKNGVIAGLALIQ